MFFPAGAIFVLVPLMLGAWAILAARAAYRRTLEPPLTRAIDKRPRAWAGLKVAFYGTWLALIGLMVIGMIVLVVIAKTQGWDSEP